MSLTFTNANSIGDARAIAFIGTDAKSTAMILRALGTQFDGDPVTWTDSNYPSTRNFIGTCGSQAYYDAIAFAYDPRTKGV